MRQMSLYVNLQTHQKCLTAVRQQGLCLFLIRNADLQNSSVTHKKTAKNAMKWKKSNN